MMNAAVHPAFEHLRSEPVASLNVVVEEYRHRKTGAQHIHIAADNPENVFLVALRTVPKDSTGVAHILEHTALCGSKKYPVRDPFFMMIRRSLNTFMNAFTSSDWTAYPFSSQNRKDFNNLMDVYLDAVFFSRIDPLDFAQEGHRLEFADPADSNSELQYKGVVFNEMKGAMSSVPSQLWQALCRYLYPTSTYHYNSGGEPEHIPDLSYEQLKAFYETHYHPSNAIFMTFGDISALEHQQKFESHVLSQFERLDKTIAVEDEKRYLAPLRVEEAFPQSAREDGDGKAKGHVVLGWLLGDSTDLEATLKAQLLAAVLLDNSASPLQHALETSALGTSPSPLCGLEDSQKELVFACGLEGCDPEQAADVEQLILSTLENIARDGIADSEVAAALHQLELQQREIGGDSYPYGLQLILTALTAATHRGDPVALLNIDPVLAKLQEAIKAPDFIQNAVRELLLDNQHRVRLTMRPDTGLADRKEQAEKLKLATIAARLSADEKKIIVDQSLALLDRQNQEDDASLLPKVGLEDIPAQMAYIAGNSEADIDQYSVGSNGLVYQQTLIDLPQLDEDLFSYLPLYAAVLTELGLGDSNYLDVQKRQAATCGAISAYTSLRGAIDDAQKVDGHLVLSAKALANNQAALSALMEDTLQQVRFDEHERLRELIAQMRARREQSVTGSGHSLAMLAAANGFNRTASISHQFSGLAGIRKLKQLDDSFASRDNISAFAQKLQAIHQSLLNSPRRRLLVGEEQKMSAYRQCWDECWSANAGKDFAPLSLPPINQPQSSLWITDTAVNFCARAFPTVTMDHPDAAPLSVLAGFLRNGYLHRAIREQGGAYGGGASHDPNLAAFRFFSYRDPRLAETLKDFDRSIEWLLEKDHAWQPVEEAILGVVSALDKPGSPAGEAKKTFHSELYGRSKEKREAFRNAVVQVKQADLTRVAQSYLQPALASTAVVSHSGNKAVAEELNLVEEVL